MRTKELQDAFNSLAQHAWFKKIHKRLSQAECALCVEFINTHGTLDYEAFDQAAVRMFLDNPSKPKSWKEIVELLVNANSLTNKTKEGAK